VKEAPADPQPKRGPEHDGSAPPLWTIPLAIFIVVGVLYGIINHWPGSHRQATLASPRGTFTADWSKKDARKDAPFMVRVVERGGPDHLQDPRMIVQARCPGANAETCRLYWREDEKALLAVCGPLPHRLANLGAPGTSAIWMFHPSGELQSLGCEKVQRQGIVGMQKIDFPLIVDSLKGQDFVPPLK
jgi:hypothetical protein